MIQWGLPEEKIVHIPHFLSGSQFPAQNNDSGDYFVFAGYLVRQKGIFTLLEAMKGFSQGRLLILGRGPEKDSVQRFIRENKMNNVEMAGFRSAEDLKKIIGESRFVIYPSEWYETFGMGILEAFLMEKPVVASNIGAYPELVIPGKTGLLFPPGNVQALRVQIEGMWKNDSSTREMGRTARKIALSEYNEELHYQRLISEFYKLND